MSDLEQDLGRADSSQENLAAVNSGQPSLEHAALERPGFLRAPQSEREGAAATESGVSSASSGKSSVPPHQFHIHHARKDAQPAQLAKRDFTPVWRRVGDTLASIALVLAALTLGIVAVVVVVSTVWLMTGGNGNLSQSMSVYTITGSSTLLILVAGFVFAAGLLVLLRFVWARAKYLNGRRGLRTLVLATFAFQLLIILAMQTRETTWGDSWMIRDFVTAALKNGIESIFTGSYKQLFHDARLYFSCYPFQAGFFWIMYGLRSVFGSYAYMVFQVIAAAGVEAGVVSLVVLGDCLGLSVGGKRVLKVLIALCLPMYWLSTFIYGNALGCGLALVFLAMQACAMRIVWEGAAGTRGDTVSDISGASAKKPGYLKPLGLVGLSLIPLSLALIVKATFVLFAIAAVIAWAIVAIRQRRAWELVLCLVVVLAARSIAGLPFEALSQASGGYEFTGPLTTLNHLELGLRMGHGEFYVSVNQGKATYAPGGWSNYANAVWEESNGDTAVQNNFARQALLGDIYEFVTDPSYALWFFSVKLATEWADPTYQSLYYLSLCGLADGTFVNPADLDTPVGMVCTVLTFVLDGWQTVVFVAAFGYLVWAIRHWRNEQTGAQAGKHLGTVGGAGAAGGATGGDAGSVVGASTPLAPNSATLLLALTFFTGFGCYLLWEAKSVYVLPFAIVVIPLAAVGLDNLFSAIRLYRARTH